MVVVPHGVNAELYKNAKPYAIKSKKKIKILANIAQPHVRKNIDGLLDAYGKAFTNKDDVVLLFKIVMKEPTEYFEVSAKKELNKFRNKYPKAGEIEVITEFIPNIESLYQAADIVFTLSKAECFYLPFIEAYACNKLVISPRYGGQLDHLNDDNSLLVDGSVEAAPMDMQYWTGSPNAVAFKPNVDDAVDKLRYAVNNYNELIEKFKPGMSRVTEKLTWDNIADQILGLTT